MAPELAVCGCGPRHVVEEAGSGRDVLDGLVLMSMSMSMSMLGFGVVLQGCISVVGKAISTSYCFGSAQTALTPGGELHVAADFRYRPGFFTVP
jgi:uncharacterized membrane protein